MTEYRLAKPEEWEDCIELANYVFSTAHRPHDFEQLIPRVYQAGPEMARIHRVAVAEKRQTPGRDCGASAANGSRG